MSSIFLGWMLLEAFLFLHKNKEIALPALKDRPASGSHVQFGLRYEWHGRTLTSLFFIINFFIVHVYLVLGVGCLHGHTADPSSLSGMANRH